MKQPSYFFSPTLLDQYYSLCNSDTIWEKYYGHSETPQFTTEEFHETKYQELIDRINNVKTPTTEAQAKGTCLNEIVDCIIKKKSAPGGGVFIKTIRSMEDFLEIALAKAKPKTEEEQKKIIQQSQELLAKIGKSFIYASLEDFEFFFDVDFCKSIAKYFDGCICQFYTAANLEISKGVVELHGYLDYFRMKSIMDLKTCKNYTFGDYAHYNQRFAYPYCMITSGMMTEVQDVEFTAYRLTGGNSRNLLISGVQNREVYTFDMKQSVEILRQNCESFIDFINNNIENIDRSTTRIFGENR